MPIHKERSDLVNRIIRDTSVIAVIGASSKRGRTSNRIIRYLSDQGFQVIPINPNESKVEGRKSYESVHELPGDLSPDMMLIFRNSDATAGEVEKIVSWSNERGVKPVIWTQIGVSSEQAEELADREGFEYVKNRCIMVDHGKLN